MVARILVVEEDGAALVAMLHALKGRGYSTIFSTDGSSAHALAKDQRPDLIVCDWRLSCHEGLQQILRDERLRSVPLLAALDSGFELAGGPKTPAGFADHVLKPIDPEAFLRTVERHLPEQLRASRAPLRLRGQRRRSDPPVWRSDP